jgi:hypothetical protein
MENDLRFQGFQGFQGLRGDQKVLDEVIFEAK